MSRSDASLIDGNTSSWLQMVNTNILGTALITRAIVQVSEQVVMEYLLGIDSSMEWRTHSVTGVRALQLIEGWALLNCVCAHDKLSCSQGHRHYEFESDVRLLSCNAACTVQASRTTRVVV
jgi:hypothetical protein